MLPWVYTMFNILFLFGSLFDLLYIMIVLILDSIYDTMNWEGEPGDVNVVFQYE